MARFFRDPLFHFLVLGLFLFGVFWVVNPQAAQNSSDPKTVIVDRAGLLKFLQFRVKAFEPKAAAARFDALSPAERQKLIDAYVREEVLYREAKTFGLEKDDYIIRQRLIQKLEFMARGFAEEATKISDADAQAYYDTHQSKYMLPADVTFTHVFFSAEKRGREGADKAAREMLAKLNDEKIPFTKAGQYGDRFPYHLNYVERARASVVSHFGEEAAKAIFSVTPSDAIWYGPLTSEFGSHLVLIIKRADRRQQSFDEVKSRIKDELTRRRIEEETEQALAGITKTYTIKVAPDAGKTK